MIIIRVRKLIKSLFSKNQFLPCCLAVTPEFEDEKEHIPCFSIVPLLNPEQMNQRLRIRRLVFDQNKRRDNGGQP